MKEFKKWEGTHSPGEYAYQKWEEAWRAALEEVLVQLNNIYDGAFDNSEIVKWIGEELGQEKCLSCGGTGDIDLSKPVDPSILDSANAKCRDCKGTGYREKRNETN